MGFTLLILFFFLMALGVPIAVSLGLGSIGAVLLFDKYSSLAVIYKIASAMDAYVLIAIPFFILAGNLMNAGGITNRIFAFARALVGHIPGGLGHANVMSNIIVSGMSGSAVADASGLGKIIIKAMEDEGYDPEFCAALTAAAATIGPIIPPSIPMVIFGAMTEVSIGSLFLGGVVPGLTLGLALMAMTYYMAIKRNYPKSQRATAGIVWVTFQEAFFPLLTPVIIIGGILSGICTPTEAAVIATAYALCLSFWYRALSFKQLCHTLVESTAMSSSIVFIIAGASAFSWIIAMEGIPQMVTSWLLSVTSNKYLILFLLNVVLLIMGMFMESLAILMIMVPFLMPLITIVGIDPVHLGVVVVLNLMIGLTTPPVGLSLFICNSIAGTKLEDVYKAILPFLIPLIGVLALITVFPDLVTALPKYVLK